MMAEVGAWQGRGERMGGSMNKEFEGGSRVLYVYLLIKVFTISFIMGCW